MYKSPIEVIMHDLPGKIVKDEENLVLLEVRKQISVEVDEYELKKALAYDRNQYEKGFEDARMKFERPHGEWKERTVFNLFGEKMKAYECSNCEKKNIGDIWIMCKLSFCPHCGADMRGEAE